MERICGTPPPRPATSSSAGSGKRPASARTRGRQPPLEGGVSTGRRRRLMQWAMVGRSSGRREDSWPPSRRAESEQPRGGHLSTAHSTGQTVDTHSCRRRNREVNAPRAPTVRTAWRRLQCNVSMYSNVRTTYAHAARHIRTLLPAVHIERLRSERVKC